jgi:putative ABC transport system permease protein
MELSALHRCLREADQVSGAFITVDNSRFDDFYDEVKDLPQVGSVNVKDLTVQSFLETTAQNLLQMRVMNIAFACIIAFGVVYNTARISLAERTRELATLRVVGFSRWETSVVLLGELALIVALAAPLGLAMGRGFAHTAAAAAETETQRFPAIVDPSTYIAAIAITLGAAAASALLVRRRIDRLDLVGALKTKD